MIQDNKPNDEETIAKLLGAIIYRETSKPDGECDTELVKACEEELANLDLGAAVSEDMLNEKLTAITGTKRGDEYASKGKRKRILKRISVAAACFILAIGMLTVTAYATVPSFNDMIRRTLHMPTGSSIADNGITYFNDDKSKEYSTIDELVRAENLDKYGVLFPDDLPTELTISSMMIVNYNNETSIEIKFTDDSISMGIKIGQSIDKISSAEQMEINGFTVYIDKYQDRYTSMMSYENNIYYIMSTNKDSIITIFEHMNHE